MATVARGARAEERQKRNVSSSIRARKSSRAENGLGGVDGVVAAADALDVVALVRQAQVCQRLGPREQRRPMERRLGPRVLQQAGDLRIAGAQLGLVRLPPLHLWLGGDAERDAVAPGAERGVVAVGAPVRGVDARKVRRRVRVRGRVQHDGRLEQIVFHDAEAPPLGHGRRLEKAQRAHGADGHLEEPLAAALVQHRREDEHAAHQVHIEGRHPRRLGLHAVYRSRVPPVAPHKRQRPRGLLPLDHRRLRLAVCASQGQHGGPGRL